MNTPCHSLPLGSARRSTHGFSLVEVTLAIAVVAIGLVGIMALFPLGMDAVRQAADSTQMMAIGQDNIAYYQQEAMNLNNYYSVLPSEVIPTTSYSTNLSVDGIWYRADTSIANAGFSTIVGNLISNYYNISLGVTNITIITNLNMNMTSRVRVGVYRINGSNATVAIGSTNYYITEVDRDVQ